MASVPSVDLSSTELSLIDCRISSLADLPLQPQLLSINLHSNYIQRLENLLRLPYLSHLDVSSNQINRIEGLDGLLNLKTLNLSSNLISVVEGLSQLRSLVKVNLSYNQIDDVSGFKLMSGPDYKLSHIEIHGNRIRSTVRLAHSLSQCSHLDSLTLCHNGATNPLCHQPGYKSDLFSRLSQLNSLDGQSKNGQIITEPQVTADIAVLEDYMDYVLSTSATSSATSVNENQILNVITPKIDEAMESFKRRCQRSYDTNSTQTLTDGETSPAVEHFSVLEKANEVPANYSHRLEHLENQISLLLNKNQVTASEDTKTSSDKDNEVIHTAKLKAEKDVETEGSECDINKTPTKKTSRKLRKTKVPNYQRQTASARNKNSTVPKPSTASSTELDDESQVSVPVKVINLDYSLRQDAATTYTHLVKELELEKERRWKSEQATKKLADYIKQLQEKAREEISIKETAIDATSHLKNVLMNEKECKERLKDQNDQLKEELERVREELKSSKQTEALQKDALRNMDKTLTKHEREKLQQDSHLTKRYQEMQMKCAALTREIDLSRQSSEKHTGKISQLQELLANREQEHREELKKRFALDSPELQKVIEKEIKQKEKEYQTEVKTQQDKIDQLGRQYSDLEDEFRMALRIEASRFQQVQEAFERICEENAGNKKDLFGALKKDEKASVMLKDLSLLVKEQKGRIAELSKSKQEQAIEYRERVQTLEAHVEEARKRMVQLELLKKEKGNLLAEVEAHQSVIDGLKAERKLWGQELAQQGSSLAQDRGRLEAKIETLQHELNTMQKNIDGESDLVKIKTKMIDDQTETIKKLKQGLLERDDEIKAAREEALKIQKSLEEQLSDEKTVNQDNQEIIDRLEERKADLKQQVNDLQTDLQESQRAHSVLNNKWKEKSNLISELEQQVGQMKQSWLDKEKKMVEERDRAVEAASLAVSKLKSVDDTFREQLDNKDKQHHHHISQLEMEKNEQIEQANRRIYVVEEEMRDLLQETENTKRGMEEKIKRMTRALGELQSDLL